MNNIEIVPAILRNTYEGVEEDWKKVQSVASHIQLDITDGVFAGAGTFRELRRFKQLPDSQKIDLHMMVHTPSNFVEDIIDLNPARCTFHLESFEGTNDIAFVYEKIRQSTNTELGIATNPESPNERLEEHLHLVQYVLFMGYNPGWAGQPLNTTVFMKIGQFKDKHPNIRIAADGHVDKETIHDFVKAGATLLYSNSAIFKTGNPTENYRQLELLAQAV